MFELNQKVKVKLHEPFGNATTESANRYLRDFVNREGWILSINKKVGQHQTYLVGFKLEAGKYRNKGILYEYELEAYND